MTFSFRELISVSLFTDHAQASPSLDIESEEPASTPHQAGHRDQSIQASYRLHKERGRPRRECEARRDPHARERDTSGQCQATAHRPQAPTCAESKFY